MSIHDRNFRPVLSRLEKFRQDITKKEVSSARTESGIELPSSGGKSNICTESDTIIMTFYLPDSSNFFEIPISPCGIFCGRVAILNQMEDYFHKSHAESSGQLTFAICGLGMKIPSLDVVDNN